MGLGTDLGDAFKDPSSAAQPGEAQQEQQGDSAQLERTESMLSEADIGYEAGESLPSVNSWSVPFSCNQPALHLNGCLHSHLLVWHVMASSRSFAACAST